MFSNRLSQLLGLCLVIGCRTSSPSVLTPVGQPLKTDSPVASAVSVEAGSVKLFVVDSVPLPDLISLQGLTFVAQPDTLSSDLTARTYIAQFDDALNDLDTRELFIEEYPNAIVSAQESTHQIYLGDFPAVTFDDFVLTFALLTLPEDLRQPQTIVDVANLLYNSRSQPFTLEDIDPIPSSFNTNYIESGEPSPDLLDVTAIYVALLLPNDLRTPEILALFINLVVPGASVTTDNVVVVPGQAIPTTPTSECEAIGLPNVTYLEHEVWSDGAKLTFMDYDRKVWVADIDPSTGRLIPEGGQGLFAGQGGIAYPNSTSAYAQGNPVEFLVSAQGTSVVFEGQDSTGTPQIFSTTIDQPNPQAEQITFGSEHALNITSRDPSFSSGYYIYIEDYFNPFTLKTVAQFEDDLPFQINIRTPKYIPGEKSVAFRRKVGSNTTISKLNLVTGNETVIVPDAADPWNIYFLNADEFNGEQVVIAQELGSNRVNLYRRQPGNPDWTLSQVFTIGSGAANSQNFIPIYNRELFNYQGGTYFFTQVFGNQDPNDDGIWLTKLDGTINFKVASSPVDQPLIDPEVFISDTNELFVYSSFSPTDVANSSNLIPNDLIKCKIRLP